mmetsp:Transcript_43876/g.113323  ORF Transcript_43876/g.113323 Transcript_43876/m.113323 type:complete len:232 (+) Transcript_43876:306-1001(+)
MTPSPFWSFSRIYLLVQQPGVDQLLSRHAAALVFVEVVEDRLQGLEVFYVQETRRAGAPVRAVLGELVAPGLHLLQALCRREGPDDAHHVLDDEGLAVLCQQHCCHAVAHLVHELGAIFGPILVVRPTQVELVVRSGPLDLEGDACDEATELAGPGLVHVALDRGPELLHVHRSRAVHVESFPQAVEHPDTLLAAHRLLQGEVLVVALFLAALARLAEREHPQELACLAPQ